ncbi:hypothetical protein KIPB_004742 [Kipferlia bialata]|uniref:Uncharacterized protein n=1 Tax=Kipferlia bialata TaxID=797122 RepID=A0A9K3CU98_9EUKA|nr:hypothetical protein KIPB_004742 [Kipferlia bialata]|eukprot:g4742.t1
MAKSSGDPLSFGIAVVLGTIIGGVLMVIRANKYSGVCDDVLPLGMTLQVQSNEVDIYEGDDSTTYSCDIVLNPSGDTSTLYYMRDHPLGTYDSDSGEVYDFCDQYPVGTSVYCKVWDQSTCAEAAADEEACAFTEDQVEFACDWESKWRFWGWFALLFWPALAVLIFLLVAGKDIFSGIGGAIHRYAARHGDQDHQMGGPRAEIGFDNYNDNDEMELSPPPAGNAVPPSPDGADASFGAVPMASEAQKTQGMVQPPGAYNPYTGVASVVNTAPPVPEVPAADEGGMDAPAPTDPYANQAPVYTYNANAADDEFF